MGIINKDKPFFMRSELLPVEARRAIDSTACYEKHSHEEFSIGIIENGNSEFYHCGNMEMISPGSVVIINANEVHSCNPTAGSTWSYKMLYLDTQWLIALQQEVLGIEFDCWIPITQPHTRCPKTYSQFHTLFDLIVDRHEVLRQEEAMIELFSDLILSNQSGDVIDKVGHKGLLRAQDFIREHYTSQLKLTDIAQVAGMSRYYLIHSFRKQFGITPHAYQLTQRVNEAKLLLRSGMDITTAALKVGFCDQSHLHRNFKKVVAATPKQYKDCF